MKKIHKLKHTFVILLLLGSVACEDLDTVNQNNPDRSRVLASGTDLISVMSGGYISWWQGIHDDHPIMALSITTEPIPIKQWLSIVQPWIIALCPTVTSSPMIRSCPSGS